MNKKDDIRKDVSGFYARSIKETTGSCCGSKPVAPTGVAATMAGYKAEELSALPKDAVDNSFGCGNPLAFSEVQSGEVVLDLGSGAGIDLLIAAEKTGPTGRVIGVDMTDDMIARARENIRKAGLDNIEVRKGIIEALPLEDASVDWVISNCVINLSPEKDRVFAEIFRVLKPGGRISISDIVARDLPNWVRRDEALYCSCVGGAVSEEEYKAGLHKAGLVDVEVKERLVYDQAQLAAFLLPESTEEGSCGCCCGGTPEPGLAKSLEGHIWSAKFAGRKPE